ncbi:iron complex outermembrane recepter protein [Flavobacterium swingsii]|uniref:Iron complex outermembrane recepter protein n=1 Tax=Flavobacterium swingsii TaxID=498292 RepID=A0A1I0YCH9_9FLAO|nr:TonB-dependent receptor [Flavobacterium swingsii]SFB10476.1 iron complex outermembrane recepter protein [Flavobacterium swingsii]
MKNLFNYKSFLLSIALLGSYLSYSQEADTTKTKNLEEVMVQAIRANEKTPVTFTNFTKKEIAKRNLGQDIPTLMNYLPSVVTTTDAGNGVGYSGIRVRGSDATRVNVTINGIPYNDSESHGTYWVNMPDFASSAENIQLQRGVGTSTNGAGAFGASLNVLTEGTNKIAGGEISNSFGSFNTHKHTVKFNTGLMNDHFEISGRLSKIKSDGYVDRAKSNLNSYFLQGSYTGKTTQIKALVFGGKEVTYQAWYGVDKETLESDRTFNAAGMYTDADGNTQFYENQVDNYNQDHYQLHWNEKISDKFNTNLAFHYTKGKGYYEEFQEKATFADYNLNDVTIDATTITESNLVTRKWLNNDFYGLTFSGNYKTEKLDVILGGGANKYEGLHYGQVIWGQYASNSTNFSHYYDDYGIKTDANVFAKVNYQITEKLNIYGDLQLRNVNYKANGVQADFVNETFNFFNPKAGVTYSLNQNSNFYASYARANREPNRTDYKNGNPRPEKLDDYELGWRFVTPKTQLNINGYYMFYKDQLVLTGALDEVGSPIRKNSGNSYRLGVELNAKFQINEKWTVAPNFSLSDNKNIDYINDEGGNLTNLGKTTIAFSPKIVAGNILTFSPLKPLQIGLLSKFVDKQFLSNIEDSNATLKDYFIQDLLIDYEFKPTKIFKSIHLNLLANNILNVNYVSNAADYGGGYIYYYPQAGANVLAGLTLKF